MSQFWSKGKEKLVSPQFESCQERGSLTQGKRSLFVLSRPSGVGAARIILIKEMVLFEIRDFLMASSVSTTSLCMWSSASCAQCFLFKIFYLFERERERTGARRRAGGEGEADSAEQGARRGTQSQDPETLT